MGQPQISHAGKRGPAPSPPPTALDTSFAEYHSRVELAGKVLRYRRELRIKEVLIPTERLPELKKFYRQVAADEGRSAVLKRVSH